MIGRTNAGGAGINFKVVGGTVQPANPKENTVWVNTSTAISSWVVSPNQPETAAAGMVWIKSGTDNSINILKKNAVEVFPTNCVQYIDGAWKNMEAYLFRNGEWVQFSATRIDLIRDGKIVDGVTFVNTRKKATAVVVNVADMTISEEAEGVRFRVPNNLGGNSASCKSPTYDFTTLSKVHYTVSQLYRGGEAFVAALGFGDPVYFANLSPKAGLTVGANQTLDVAHLVGDQFLTLGIHTSGSYVTLTDLWFE